MNFKISALGLALIKSFEGLSLKAYRDQVGVLTIGYGTTNSVLPKDKKIVLGQVIDLVTAEQYLTLAVDSIFSIEVNRLVKVNIDQKQFDALVCFAYNCGVDHLTSSTLLKKLNAGDFAGAQKEFLKWNQAGGVAVRGLTRRRLAEAFLFGGLSRQELIDQCLHGIDPDKK
jgi:lysozyme